MIRTLKDTFYIQPLPSHLIKNDVFKDGHPHVIYRRSISEEVSSDCYVSGNSFNLRTLVRKIENRKIESEKLRTNSLLDW